MESNYEVKTQLRSKAALHMFRVDLPEDFVNSINKYVSDNGLTIKSYESYADHYSNTLAIWRNEFNKKWDLIKNQGFDLTFKRMWEFYLCYCEAGFKSKNIDLIQFSIQNK